MKDPKITLPIILSEKENQKKFRTFVDISVHI